MIQRSARALSVLILASLASAQCKKPQVPSGGFPVVIAPDQFVTYSDGYKTKGDLLVPGATAPSCGWPLVVWVHGLGGSRTADRSEQALLTARGYAVWAYDLRGQGDAIKLNAPGLGHAFESAVEKCDLAEQIGSARAAGAGKVSPSIVAVTGFSLGGIHAWAAAALSGQPVSAPGRAALTFPQISAVVPRGFVAEPTQVRVKDGALFERLFIDYVAGTSPNSILDSSFRQLVQGYFLLQDPQGLEASFRSEPLRTVLPLLATTMVPILYQHGFHDAIRGPQQGLDALHTLPKSTPWRAAFGALGHGGPGNDAQLLWFIELYTRWFDRFLWQSKNGVEDEAKIVSFVPPLDPVVLSDHRSVWRTRFETSWPPPDSAPLRLFTTTAGTLDASPSSRPGTAGTITHSVAPAYDASSYLASWLDRQTVTILAKTPLSECRFVSTPFAAETEIAGTVHVHVSLVTNAPDSQITALLLARPPGATTPVMLAGEGHGIAHATPQAPVLIDFDLGPVVSVLPAGTTLELVLRNLWLPEPPMSGEIIAVPSFTPYSLTIMSSNVGRESTWIEIPIRRKPKISCASAAASVTAAAPTPFPLDVRAGSTRARLPYAITGTMSGHDPFGLAPIRFDALSSLLVTASPLTPGFTGTLDVLGAAQASFDLSALPALIPALKGQRITFSAYVVDGGVPFGGSFSSPLDLILR